MTNWPGLSVLTALPTSSTTPQIFVSHRRRLSDRLKAAIGPQVRPADARRGHPDESVRRLDDRRGVALLETKIARAVENSSSHCRLSLPGSNPALVARSQTHRRT